METRHLLDDESFLAWLRDGYITVSPRSLDAADHDYFYRRANELYELADRSQSPTLHLDIVGDNLRAQIPRLDDLLQDPDVHGALVSLVGEDYLLHPHHFVHVARAADQGFHQDGNLPWNERGHYRPHRPDWALLFYYPQEVTLDNGPTEIVAGTQYWTKDFEKTDGDWHRGDPVDRTCTVEDLANDDLPARDQRIAGALAELGVPDLDRRFVTVAKGTVAICSYDIVHRGSRTHPGQAPRYMYKFYFARAHEPRCSSWARKVEKPDLATVADRLKPVVNRVWHWSNGSFAPSGLNPASLPVLSQALAHGREDEKIAAAYQLAEVGGRQACAILADALANGSESVRRSACYGLRAIGEIGVEPLVELARSPFAVTRRMAAYALGNADNSDKGEVVDVLLELLTDDPDDLVRSNTAYALGHLLRGSGLYAEAMVDALLARLQPGVEPNNTEVARLPRSTVRQSIAYALFQGAANGCLSGRHLEVLVATSADDADRYVQGFVLEALRRSESMPKCVLAKVLSTLTRTRFNQTPAH